MFFRGTRASSTATSITPTCLESMAVKKKKKKLHSINTAKHLPLVPSGLFPIRLIGAVVQS